MTIYEGETAYIKIECTDSSGEYVDPNSISVDVYYENALTASGITPSQLSTGVYYFYYTFEHAGVYKIVVQVADQNNQLSIEEKIVWVKEK